MKEGAEELKGEEMGWRLLFNGVFITVKHVSKSNVTIKYSIKYLCMHAILIPVGFILTKDLSLKPMWRL